MRRGVRKVSTILGAEIDRRSTNRLVASAKETVTGAKVRSSMHSSCEQPNCGRCLAPDGYRRLSHHWAFHSLSWSIRRTRGQQVTLLHRGCEKLQFVGQIVSQFCPCGSCPKEAGTYNIIVGLGGVFFACSCPPATEFNPEKQVGHLILLSSTCARALNPPHFWASKHPWFDGLGALLGHAPKVSRRDSRCLFEEPDHEQENHCPDNGVDDCHDDAADENKPDPRQEPASKSRRR